MSAEVELLMLREFYDCWRAFHSTPKDGAHRPILERAAQRLSDSADVLERYKASLTEPEVIQ